MTMIGWSWFAGGLLLGCFRSAALWNSAKRPSHWTTLLGMGRVLAVGAVLAGAAFAGKIYPAFPGWALGFLGCVAVVCFRGAK